MDISQHLNKSHLNNLHHAYLIEGMREEILPEILSFMKVLGVATSGNPDFCEIHIDNFKMDEAMLLKGMTNEKSYSSDKKIFIVSANNFSLDAQHALLKMFEEPKEDTHFFLIIPDKNALLDTLVSRFYIISPTLGVGEELKEAERFIKMSINARVNFLKDFLIEEESEDEVAIDSIRAKSLRFLNNLEIVLHHKFKDNFSKVDYFYQIFKVRKFLRQPGASTKSLMESLALVIPNF